MDKIEFHIQPSSGSPDHEVRILVNGIDIIPDKMLGLDPVDGWEESLLGQEALTSPGELIYARCSCGVVGCGSDAVDVTRSESAVTWTFKWTSKKSFTFDARQYDSAIAELKSDFGWETPERTAERLIKNLDFNRFLAQGLELEWVSGRTENKITLSFDLQEGETKYQVLCHARWENHEAPNEAVSAIEKVLKDAPKNWPDVEYLFQSQVRTRPTLAGPGWREYRA